MAKNFPLRILDKKVYPILEREAKLKRWSVNTLINTIIENHQAKNGNGQKKGKRIYNSEENKIAV